MISVCKSRALGLISVLFSSAISSRTGLLNFSRPWFQTKSKIN